MAEKDAFGNDIGSGSSTPTPVPGPTPAGVPAWTPPPDMPGGHDTASAAAPPPPPPPAPAWTPPPTSATPSNLPPVQLSNVSAGRAVGGGRGRSPIGIIITLVVAALIIGLPLTLAFDSGTKAIDQVNNAINQVTSNPSSPSSSSSASPSSPSVAAKEPVGVGTGSLVRPFAVAKFVKTRVPGKGKLVMLRVSPQNLQAQTRTSVGSLHILYSDYKGLNTDTKSQAGGFGSQPSIPLSKIDAQAPMRMVKHIPRHSAGIDYVLLEPFQGDLKWLAYYKNSNRFYSADLHGRHIQQIG